MAPCPAAACLLLLFLFCLPHTLGLTGSSSVSVSVSLSPSVSASARVSASASASPNPSTSPAPTPDVTPTSLPPSVCTLSTLAGSGAEGSEDGVGTLATLRYPSGLALDAASSLWVADTGNCQVRRFSLASSQLSKVAGLGTASCQGARSVNSDGALGASSLYRPVGCAVGSGGEAYVAQADGLLRLLTPYGALGSLLLTPGSVASGGLFPPNASAPANFVGGLAAAPAGGPLYFTSAASHAIYATTSTPATAGTGALLSYALLAGAPGVQGWSDSMTGIRAQFASPSAAALAPPGTLLYPALFVADTRNHAIRCVDLSDGRNGVKTLAGSSCTRTAGCTPGSANGIGTSTATFSAPSGIAVDGSGRIYVSDTGNHLLRQLLVTGRQGYFVTTLTGIAGNKGFADGLGAMGQLSAPTALAVDGLNNLIYIADTGNNALRLLDCSATYTPGNGADPATTLNPSPTASITPTPTPTPTRSAARLPTLDAIAPAGPPGGLWSSGLYLAPLDPLNPAAGTATLPLPANQTSPHYSYTCCAAAEGGPGFPTPAGPSFSPSATLTTVPAVGYAPTTAALHPALGAGGWVGCAGLCNAGWGSFSTVFFVGGPASASPATSAAAAASGFSTAFAASLTRRVTFACDLGNSLLSSEPLAAAGLSGISSNCSFWCNGVRLATSLQGRAVPLTLTAFPGTAAGWATAAARSTSCLLLNALNTLEVRVWNPTIPGLGLSTGTGAFVLVAPVGAPPRPPPTPCGDVLAGNAVCGGSFDGWGGMAVPPPPLSRALAPLSQAWPPWFSTGATALPVAGARGSMAVSAAEAGGALASGNFTSVTEACAACACAVTEDHTPQLAGSSSGGSGRFQVFGPSLPAGTVAWACTPPACSQAVFAGETYIAQAWVVGLGIAPGAGAGAGADVWTSVALELSAANGGEGGGALAEFWWRQCHPHAPLPPPPQCPLHCLHPIPPCLAAALLCMDCPCNAHARGAGK